MSRVSIDLDGPRIVLVYRCDRCGWETSTPRTRPSGRPMRLRPIQPIPLTGTIQHECEDCVQTGRV